jgi:hypothetical protein
MNYAVLTASTPVGQGGGRQLPETHPLLAVISVVADKDVDPPTTFFKNLLRNYLDRVNLKNRHEQEGHEHDFQFSACQHRPAIWLSRWVWLQS